MTWRAEKQASAEFGARMDVAALVATVRNGDRLPEGEDLRLRCAVETLVVLAEGSPEVLDMLLAAAPEQVVAGACHRLVHKAQVFLLMREAQPWPGYREKGNQQ